MDKTEGQVPTPQTPDQFKLLLMRWNALKAKGVDETTHFEFKQLSKTLARLSKQQKEYEQRLDKLNASRKKVENDDVLTRAQVQSFKLLSYGVDLPQELQGMFKPHANGYANGKSHDQSFVGREHAAALEPYKADKRNSSVGGVAEQIIRNRVTYRLAELESLPANLGTFIHGDEASYHAPDDIFANVDQLKIKALIELKALRLLTKQKSLRQRVVVQAADSPELKKIKNRTNFRLHKVQTEQEVRLTEDLERKQRKQREKKEHEKRMNKFAIVRKMSGRLSDQGDLQRRRRDSFAKVINNIHKDIDKDESKRSERTAKQRLQALRANDEEAYIKLLDQTKDTRITHLLGQTNQFLKSLSAAVQVQQQDGGMEMSNEGTDDDYYNIAHRVQEEINKQPTILVGGSLKEYQIKGLEWMVSLYNNNLNGILADEMGLGKTIQSISLITYLIQFKKQRGPFLVIVPLSTLTNWNMEFEKWAPSVKRVVYKGPPNARKGQQAVIRSGDFQVLLTTYEYIIKDRALLSKIRWQHMIIDEGHRMKNTQSKLSNTLTTYYYSKHRLILTGTPLQNNLPELWALLNFVLPKIFNSVKTFDEWFNTPFANTGGQDKMELTEEETLLIIRRLHKVLRPFLLRRLKKDVEKDLPDKVEKVLKCKMSALQAKLYEQMVRHGVLYIGNQQTGSTGKQSSSIKGLNNKIMQLRKICNHPFVFEEVENLISPGKLTNDDLWRVAGKFELLDRILPKFKATGHRVLMFFQMTQIMDIMEDYMRLKGMQYLRLDGSTKADERSDMLKLFNAPDSPYFAFLLSTRAGGLGLNLQTADTVIIYDTDWNPHQDLQAQDRAHRIGQTKEVRILRLITENTVEEQILERAQTKLEIDGKVIQAGKFDNKSTSEEQEAFLRSLIEAEEQKRNAQEEDDEMDDDELNEILARGDNELEVFQKLDHDRIVNGEYGRNKSKDRLYGDEELPEDYHQDIEEHLEPDRDEILGRGARERKSIQYDDGLTEEQWLDAVDDDDDTIEAAIARKHARQAKRIAKIEELGPEAAAEAISGVAAASAAAEAATATAASASAETAGGEEEDAPAKRKRQSMVPEVPDARPTKRKARKSKVEDEELGEPEPSSKRSRRKSKINSKEPPAGDLQLKAHTIVDVFKNSVDSDGRARCDLFLELPSREDYPDYYQTISSPIALDTIENKLAGSEYSSLDEIKSDFAKMLDNCRQYNVQGSLVYEDADELEKELTSAYSDL